MFHSIKSGEMLPACLQVSFGFLTSLLRVIKELWATSEPTEINSTQALLAILKKVRYR